MARKAVSRQHGGLFSNVVFSEPVLFVGFVACVMKSPLAAPGCAVVAGLVWCSNMRYRAMSRSMAMEQKRCADMWISMWNDVGVDVAAAEESTYTGRSVSDADSLFGECVLLGRVSSSFASEHC